MYVKYSSLEVMAISRVLEFWFVSCFFAPNGFKHGHIATKLLVRGENSLKIRSRAGCTHINIFIDCPFYFTVLDYQFNGCKDNKAADILVTTNWYHHQQSITSHCWAQVSSQEGVKAIHPHTGRVQVRDSQDYVVAM